MTERPSARPPHRDDDEIAAEFARILNDEGLALRPGTAPHEPPALPPAAASTADSPPSPSPEEREAHRARARAAHPSSRRLPPQSPPEDEEDDVLLGDFEPPDPDITPPSDGALWAWGALLGGVLMLLLTATTDLLPSWCGPLGGAIAVGGLVALLLRVPRGRDPFDDGAQV